MAVIKILLGAIVGGFLGHLYYKKVGCPSGSCPITSKPLSSTIYGVILGTLIMSSF